MRVILISGASAGFGMEAAKKFIENGDFVIGLARRKERLDELKVLLGERFLPVVADVTNHKKLKKAIESIPEPFNQIDVLVNNAGLALGQDPAFEADFSDWETMIDVNTKGLTYLTHLVLPQMVERNHGYIINLSSIAGNYPYKGSNVYGATKAFVTQFSLNLRADLVGKNIRVTNVEPGLCSETEFSNVRFKGDDERAADVYADVKAITGEDVANILVWLSNQPEHVNINRIEMMPTAQTFNGLTVHKGDL